MDNTYDLIVIGAGPAGLALCQCLRNTYTKILLIERESQIGGCHKVERVQVNNEFVFTEHGPRVYVDNYLTFKMLLKDMDSSFEKLFTKYNFSSVEIMTNNVLSKLSFIEILKLTKEFLLVCVNENHGKNIQLKQYLTDNKFSTQAIDTLNRVCILLDGGDVSKYTLNELLQIFNQGFFYNIYQPKVPNDKGLFKLWYDFLVENKIEVKLDSEVISIDTNPDSDLTVVVEEKDIRQTYFGKKVVIAAPPSNLVGILQNSRDDIKNSFGDFNKLQKFSNDTKYIDYICITFHWDKKLDIPKVFYGFPSSDWGLISIVLSHYMEFDETVSKTLISSAISIADVPSKRTGKTANQSSKDELFDEAWYQLQLSYPTIKEKPTLILLYPSCYYDDSIKAWKNEESAFISTSNQGFIDFESKTVPNLYTLGTHNGKQRLKYTVLDTAVTNAVELSYILDPKLKDKYHIQSPVTVSFVLKLILTIIVIIIIIFMLK